jgi:hypothetical protein
MSGRRLPQQRIFAAVATSLVGLAASALFPVAADAAVFTYRSQSKRAGEIKAAVAAWNGSGVRVQFVKARRGQRVDVRFVDAKLSGRGLGEAAGGVIKLSGGYEREYSHDPLLTTMGRTAAHELGHFLGLGHSSRCSIMAVGGQADFLDWCRTSRTSNTVPCGPQRADARAVARRFGWRPGGHRRMKARGFGRCPYADGPSGARFRKEWCGPAHIQLEDEHGRRRDGTLAFTGEEWRDDSSAECRWYTINNHVANDNYFAITVRLITPSGVEPPFRVDGATYPGVPASGNCDGTRVDDEDNRYSPYRYLTVRANLAELGPAWRPTAGHAAMLAGVFERAEAAGVGLACADGRRR